MLARKHNALEPYNSSSSAVNLSKSGVTVCVIPSFASWHTTEVFFKAGGGIAGRRLNRILVRLLGAGVHGGLAAFCSYQCAVAAGIFQCIGSRLNPSFLSPFKAVGSGPVKQ